MYMKAVIFSCSLHKAKYSNTRAWAEFASPTNLLHPTFYCANLVNRFVHAYEKSKKKNIDIFKNKIWEYCCLKTQLNFQGGYRAHETFQEWVNHHGYMIEKLKFMEYLGLKNTCVLTRGATFGLGPTYADMEDHSEVVEMCDNVVDTFITKITPTGDYPTPDCTLDEFMECLRSDDSNAFGRGMTIADENINDESVKAHIKHIHDTMDVAEQYYVEHFKLMANKEYESNCSGNYKPNGY